VSDIDILLISNSFNQQNYFQCYAVIDVNESQVIIYVTDNLCQWYRSCESQHLQRQRSSGERATVSPVGGLLTRVTPGKEGGKDGFKLFDSRGG
jgi:hypothetical protein